MVSFAPHCEQTIDRATRVPCSLRTLRTTFRSGFVAAMEEHILHVHAQMLRLHKCSARVPSGMQGLTSRQRQILEFITRRIEEQGYPPTIREIGEEMGIRSTNGVNDHLKALERKGFLKREGLKSRALKPMGAPSSPSKRKPEVMSALIPENGETIAIPVLGRVAAGSPILADEHVETTVHVDSFF